MMVFIIVTFFQISSSKIHLRKLYRINEIILTISGTGEQKILSDRFKNMPNEILVNGDLVSTNTNKVSCSESVSSIIMRCNSIISD